MTANEQLAEQLIRQADDHMHERRVLLVTATALATTPAIPAARKAIADPDAHIPPAVRAAALEVLEQLATDHLAGQAGEVEQEGTT